MQRIITAVVLLLLCTVAVAAQEKQSPANNAAALETQERGLWQAFKNKDRATLSAMLDDGFHLFEEGLSAIGDKKAEVNAVDDFELVNYTLSDFTVKSVGPNAALVTYVAQYEGKSGGEISKAKSVFAEVWIRSGNQWKDMYLQETYMK
jgi:hypothetical protein